ncbi:BZ3500_MvSof-1268-A1-R1_Chr1-1g00935 [Microbotryum saponariae]|uniref:BZ3500_MvSof-1268-A1-R1_Chr1-1g00935 protein n=1 Tax=Microbotryum saponariae TaxID=289078 RepID=A0A2X0LAY9_9BASI|nr:BZ3500_MvSof-1268-A1-R1_Chr1-1g00935 [Microbotryum saponariae]SCZ92973.1 BZ3501_MvSof-1269-A2-R1_Chr1-1g00532 [Microbotryum saponariae]
MTTPTYKGKNKIPPSTGPILTRLHISGLAPSVQAKDIVDRFATFGQVEGGVEGVDGLKVDANADDGFGCRTGDRKGYAFVNLHTTTHQLNKFWKGHKLRIAPAKADYTKRLESERAIAADVAAGLIPDPYLKKKKKRRNPDPNVGFEATHFELVSPENIDQHRVGNGSYHKEVDLTAMLTPTICCPYQGWTLDTTIPSAPIALFPLIVRPSHPIFPPAKPAPTSWTRETPKARQARQARESRIKAALERPVLRSKRMRIDPRKWGRRRVVFDRDQEEGEGVGVGVGKAVMRGYWECEEVEGRSMGEEVAWVYKAPDGTVRRREVISLGAARFGERTDRFTALLEGLNRPEGGAKVETVHEEDKEVQEDDDSNPEPNDEDDLAGSPERPTKRLKSLSPPPYVPVAPRSLLYNEEDAFALLSTTREEAELTEARRLEKEAQLKVLMRLVEVEQEMDSKHEDREKAEVQGIEGRKLPKVEGFANDDDDDWGEVLRLRGGAKTSSDEEEDSSDDDTSDDEDEDESSGEEEEDVAAPVASTSTKPAAEETSTLKRGMLKEMFKPKAAEASFSMLDGLDLELEELERTPSPPPQSHFNAGMSISSAPYQHRNTFIAPPALGRSSRAWVGTAPTTPFFPFPSGAFEVRGTGEINEDEVKKMGMTMEKAEELKRESERNLAEGVNKFWAYESPEEFEKLHQELRDKLRGHARKRHREAVKKQSKSGKKGATTIL